MERNFHKWIEELYVEIKAILQYTSSLVKEYQSEEAQDPFQHLHFLERTIYKCLYCLNIGLKGESFANKIQNNESIVLSRGFLISLRDILDLLSHFLYQEYQINWGQHLIGDSFFRGFNVVRFSISGLENNKLKKQIIVKAIIESFFISIQELSSKLRDYKSISDIEEHITVINEVLGGGTWRDRSTSYVIKNNLDLFNESEVIKQLEISSKELTDLVSFGKILEVRDWLNQRQYPVFQFDRNEILSLVKEALEISNLNNCSWSTALYLNKVYQNKELGSNNQKIEKVKNQLRLAGRLKYKPSDKGEEIDPNNSQPEIINKGTELFRISQSAYTPFFFTSYSKLGEGGRFDLSGTPPIYPNQVAKGSLYTAKSIQGACCEVFRREPIITLEDLLSRTLWKIKIGEDIPVFNLKGILSQLTATTDRIYTQKIAQKVDECDKYKGLLSRLRTNGDEEGVTLFGLKGASPPTVCNFGVWQVKPCPLLDDHQVISFITEERKHEAFPIIHLQRFPSKQTFK